MKMRYYAVGKKYIGNKVSEQERREITATEEVFFMFDKALKLEITDSFEGTNKIERLKGSFKRGMSQPVTISIEAEIEDWDWKNYVFMPGAVYGGNRFESKALSYPPYAEIPKEEVLSHEPVIADIPRLSTKENASSIKFRAGDMTTPAAGAYDFEKKQGIILLGEHINKGHYTGFEVNEDKEKRKLCLSHSFPSVRGESKYFFGEKTDGSGFFPDNKANSDDQGICFEKGENFTIPFQIACFHAEELYDFFTYFNKIRQNLEAGSLAHTIPFSAAYHEVRNKYQRENYHTDGYFTVGTDWSIPQQCFQAGWTGGGMNYYSFLFEDKSSEVYIRARNSFCFILDKIQNEKGWIHGIYADGIRYGDNFKFGEEGSCLLVRKNADILYFFLKELILLEEREEDMSSYREKIQMLADAFVRLLQKYGQIGQFIDIESEEMLTGNSSGAGIAVAALALAGEYFGKEDYTKAAEKLGELYYSQYVKKGILNGAPGEICQAPDSEAAFGLLEGYICLYDSVKKSKWLDYAKQTCEIALTWVMSYDFCFSQESTAAKRRIHTLGTVFANAQNKHSAPGICTLSGNSLLRLYRMTGERRYLEWLSHITHSLTQSVSMENNPIFTLDKQYLPKGYMNERVQTSDWEGKETIGEFLYGSNWPEVSMMLTYAEIPSIYLEKDGTITNFDHCETRLIGRKNGYLEIEIVNPTEYDAVYTVLVDSGYELQTNYFGVMQKAALRKGERKNFLL